MAAKKQRTAIEQRTPEPDNDDGGLSDLQCDQITAFQQNFKWGPEAIAQALKLPEDAVQQFLAPPQQPTLHLVRPGEQASIPNSPVLYDAARNVLAAMVRIDEVKMIRDQAEALQVYAQHAQDTALLDYATEYRLLAERRAGELLKRMNKAKGSRGQLKGRKASGGINIEPPENDGPTLKALGIKKTQSSRWQKLADLAPSAFETYVADAKRKQKQAITAAQRKASRDKHHWLTPPDVMAKLEREFGPFDFDPCPYPRPEGFDGLKEEWGQCNYVNPMFQGGMTAWVKKAIEENQKGKTVVMVFPLDGWVHMLLKAGAIIGSIGNVKWLATEDGTPGKGISRPTATFYLPGGRKRKK